MLSNKHYLVVFDAWRPYEVQLELYRRLKEELQAKRILNIEKELSLYVDTPSKDAMKPSNHLTGGAIDLTIATKEVHLNMGTCFDDFSEGSRTDAYENMTDLNDEELLIRENRRMLKRIMENAGFANYSEEWWHYDYGNQNWAKSVGKHMAFYRGVLKLKDHIKV